MFTVQGIRYSCVLLLRMVTGFFGQSLCILQSGFISAGFFVFDYFSGQLRQSDILNRFHRRVLRILYT